MIEKHRIGNFLILFLGLVLFQACDSKPQEGQVENQGAGQVIPDEKKPVFKFKETSFNFGTANEGEEITHEFEFTNEGKSDLLISNAIASCGCTIPEWPKEPIPPGKGGKIKATFNTTGKSGQQHKVITITANVKSKNAELVIEGEVFKKEEKNN